MKPSRSWFEQSIREIQRCFMRHMYSHDSYAYEVRLRTLGISSLQSRRHSSDLIFAYKLLHGFIDVETKACGMQLISSNTRGNGINLNVHPAKSSCVAKMFSHSVPKVWNKLPIDINLAKSFTIFKNKLL